MGNFEKLVVLTVLFAAAIVLAISLNRGGGEAEASGPLSGAQAVLEQEGALPESPDLDGGLASEPPAPEKQPSLLLNAGAESAAVPEETPEAGSEAPALSLEPVSDPSRRILTDTNGLRPSFLDDYMVYTVAAGDTWSALAQRFFQDGRYTRNLHLANEGLSDLVPESEILVPVYDFIAQEAGLQPGDESLAAGLEPAGSVLTADAAPGAAPATNPPGGPGASGAGAPLEYVVQPGDTLSDIALASLGSAARWKEIYDLNKDKLQKPEWLQVGMKLKLPAGGKLPAKTTKKLEEKPKTAQASGARKKKVL